MKIKSVSFKLMKVKSGVATFDIKFEVGGDPSPGLKMTMALSGTMTISAGCWPLKADMKGTVGIEGSQGAGEQKIGMLGSGSVAVMSEYSYK